MKIITAVLVFIMACQQAKALAPPPVNFKEEIIKIEDKYYLITYDENHPERNGMREIEYQETPGIPPWLMTGMMCFSITFWIFLVWLIYWMIS